MATELHELAIAIADLWARSEIELSCYSFTRNRECDTSTCDPEQREAVDNAIRYIELRGDALPYRMIRKGNKVMFE